MSDDTVQVILCEACAKQIGMKYVTGTLDLSTMPPPEKTALFTEYPPPETS